MRKISGLILAVLLTVSFSGCEVIRPAETRAAKITTTDSGKTKTSAGSEKTNADSKTTAVIENPAATAPATTAAQTTPAATAAPESKPVTKSNLPPELKAELDKTENGIMLIYYPDKFPEIKAITRWNIVDYNTNTQVLLVSKKKGSTVEVSKAQLTNDDRVVIPGDVIRDWETTSDYEVIRILYTDPETIPFNFIRVKEPGGKVTTTHLRTSMRDNPDWEVYPYDKQD